MTMRPEGLQDPTHDGAGASCPSFRNLRDRKGTDHDPERSSHWSAVAAPLAVSADPLTTYLAVRAGAVESHPLWATAIGQVGLGPAMTIRLLVGLALVAAVIVAVEHEGTPMTRWVLRTLTAIFALVAAWNLGVWIAS
jgi:hypothetical protein